MSKKFLPKTYYKSQLEYLFLKKILQNWLQKLITIIDYENDCEIPSLHTKNQVEFVNKWV